MSPHSLMTENNVDNSPNCDIMPYIDCFSHVQNHYFQLLLRNGKIFFPSHDSDESISWHNKEKEDGTSNLMKGDNGDARSINRLRICLILPDFFGKSRIIRPENIEIFSNLLQEYDYSVLWVVPHENREIEKYFFGKSEIIGVPLLGKGRNVRFAWGYVNYLAKEAELCNKICKDADLIHVRNSSFNALIGLLISRKYRIPFVYHLSYSKDALWGDKKNIFRFLVNLLDMFISRIILKKSDLVIAQSFFMRNRFIEYGIDANKIFVLPMGVNPNLFSPSRDPNNIREKLGLEKAKVVIYSGTMDRLRKLDILLSSFQYALVEYPELRLLMVGDGNDRSRLEKQVINLGLKNKIIFTGQVPYSDVPNFVAASDIAICPIPPLPVYMQSSPTKLFEYMGAERPIIANGEIPEQRFVLEESNGGILVDFNAKSFAQAIVRLSFNNDMAIQLGKNGREWVLRNRTYDILTKNLDNRYRQLIMNGK